MAEEAKETVQETAEATEIENSSETQGINIMEDPSKATKKGNRPRSNRVVGIVVIAMVVFFGYAMFGLFGIDDTAPKKLPFVGGKKTEQKKVITSASEDEGEVDALIQGQVDLFLAEQQKKQKAATGGTENFSDNNLTDNGDFEAAVKKGSQIPAQQGKVGDIAPDGKLVIKNTTGGSVQKGQAVPSKRGGSRYLSQEELTFVQQARQLFQTALQSSPVVQLKHMQDNSEHFKEQKNTGNSNRENPLNASDYVTRAEADSFMKSGVLNLQKTDSDRNEDFVNKSQAGGTIKDEYLPNTRRRQLAKLEIKAGTVINGVLVSGINSDMPGTIIGQVSENVYDTASGMHLLIPQGSRLIGTYSSHVVYGQKRVLTVWTRIIYPDGSSLNIGGLTGGDQAGYSGFKQKINNHYGNLLSAALFSSVFVWIGKEATKNDTDIYNRENKAAEAVMEQVSNLGARLAERNLNVAPTLTIKPGYRFTIITTKDVMFAEEYIAGGR